MGLLDKTNPQATRESVIRQALLFGTGSVVALLLYFAWSAPQDPYWPLYLLLAGISGAFAGGLMEWQVADGLNLCEVLLEVEEEFAVELPKENDCDTVGDLYEMTLAAQRKKPGIMVDEQETWNRLKTLLVEQLGVNPEQVVAAARFYIDIRM